MHVHCLHWLKLTGLLFLNVFCRLCKFTTGEMAPKEGPIWLWGPDMAPTVSTCLSSPCSGILVFVGASTRHSYSELYYLCLISSLFKLLPPPTQPPCPSHPPPNIHWPNINEFHEKNCKKLAKTSHYLLVRLVLQKLIDN